MASQTKKVKTTKSLKMIEKMTSSETLFTATQWAAKQMKNPTYSRNRKADPSPKAQLN
jgi:hypothetical protein